MMRLLRCLVVVSLLVSSAAFADDNVRISPTSDPAAGITPSVSTALVSNRVLKSGAGNLYGFNAAFATCASYPCWVLLFDATALPADGPAQTPIRFYQVGANSTLPVMWAPGPPLHFKTGLVIGCSTTGPFTLTATAQCAIAGDVK